MLYKTIIVDDEPLIRETLAEIFDWNELGFEISRVFSDGKEVIEYINDNQVDFIISDIKMTFVSGIELSKYIFDNKLDIKVVLVSAYKEFDFAKQAIQYGVTHYILKPVDIKELRATISDVKKQLDKKQAELERLKNERRQFDYVVPLVQRQFIYDIIMGEVTDKEEINARKRVLGMSFDYDSSICTIVNLEAEDYQSFLDNSICYTKDAFYKFILDNIKNEYLGITAYVLKQSFSKIELILMFEGDYNEDALKKYLDMLTDGIKEAVGLKISCELSGKSETLNNLYTPDLPKKDESFINEILKQNSVVAEKQKMLIYYINAGNMEGVENIFLSFIDDLSEYDISIIHNFIIDMFSMLNNKMKELSIDVFSIEDGMFSYNSILEMKTVSEIKELGRQVFKKIMNDMAKSSNYSSKQLIRKAKEYIVKHCCEDITLEDVANDVYLNPVYLSRLFKEQTGENFSDYLIGRKISRAMELLKNEQYKVYEISSMVGYKSVQYFYRIFKQYTGLTPAEYRNNKS